MFIGTPEATPPSFRERMREWVPSLSSLPSVPVPSLNSCKNAFLSLTERFRSSTFSLHQTRGVDLTRVTLPAAIPNEEHAKYRRRCVMYVVAAATTTCAAAYGLMRYCQSQMPQLSDGLSASQNSDLAIANVVVASPLTQYAGEALQLASRTLLSAIPLSLANTLSNCSIFGTEEVALFQSFNTWDVFPYVDQGQLIVSTSSELPTGVSLVQSPIKILNSINIPNTKCMVNKDNALYVASSDTGTVKIVNSADVSNLYIQNIFDAGAVISNMMAQGEQLIMTGAKTLLKSFDISDPFSPVFQGEVLNSTITGNVIAKAGTGNQFGCLTTNGFFYIDGNNFNVTGIIPNLRGYAISASEDCYFVGTQTGLLVSLNATSSSSPIGTLPISGIFSILYENGYCFVGTTTKFLVVDVQDPANMQIVYSSSTTTASFLSSGNLLYYCPALEVGFGIIDKTNITHPTYSTNGLLPSISGIYSFLSAGSNIIINQGNMAYFITKQDAFSFSGTPLAGSKGRYPVTLRATTLTGQIIDASRVCEVTIAPAITSSSQLSNLIAGVNRVFSATIQANAFKHVLGLPMTYSLECPDGKIKDVFSLNPVSGQFSGNPQSGDVGYATCVVEAIDSFSASATSSPFNITVTYGPTLSTISNQLAIIGEPFSLNFTFTSQDPSSTFTSTVANLPSSFTYVNDTISGTPTSEDLGTYSIDVTVTDQNGISTTQSFTFNVIQPGVPVFVRPISSVTVFINNPFTIEIPTGTAINPSNPNAQITYSATLADGSSLPSWMSFDGTTFRGTPPSTAKIYYDVTHTIALTATQISSNGQRATSISNFNVTVSGTTIIQVLTNVGGPSLAVLTTLFALRVRLHNAWVRSTCALSTINRVKSIFCCCKCSRTEFHQVEETHVEGQGLTYEFKTPSVRIAGFTTLYDGRPCPDGALPHWLKPEEAPGPGRRKIISTDRIPELHGIKSINITPFNKTGYHLETVTFNIVRAVPQSNAVTTPLIAATPTSIPASIAETPASPSSIVGGPTIELSLLSQDQANSDSMLLSDRKEMPHHSAQNGS